MARLEPLAPDANPELQDNFQHFKKLLGYVQNNDDTMAPPLEEEPAEFAKKHLPRHF